MKKPPTRTHTRLFRFTAEEIERFNKAAADQGMDLSEYVRFCLNHPPKIVSAAK